MGGGLGRVAHHPEYYFSDGSVSFLTNNTLFRVHRYYFERESEVFRRLFEEAAQDPQSGTDACPFTLDVSPEEFTQFLWVWYDREYSYQQQTKEKWVTILRLATKWEFNKIKELALRELEALEIRPAERISIYNDHSIDGERVVSSFVELCKSPTVPTEEDAHLLKMEGIIKLLQAREEAQRQAVKMGHNSPTSASLEDEALREIVSGVLKPGLDSRSGGDPTGSGDQAPDLKGDEDPHGTAASTTILKTPQVPDRKTTPASGALTHPKSLQTDSEAKGNHEKGKDGAEDKNVLEKMKEEQAKENEEKEKQAKAKAQKEERERLQNAGRGRGRAARGS